jgi:transposase-like protein
MCNAAMLPSVEATPRPRTRYFSARGCVIVDEDQRHVVVGGMLVGSFHVDDLAGRNVILVGLARDPRVHLERLAEAFEIDDETLRRIRRRFEAGGLEAIVEPKQGGREKVVTARIERQLFELFDEGASVRQATARLNGRKRNPRVSIATVGRVRQLWTEQRQTVATEQRSEHAGEAEQMDLPSTATAAAQIDGPANDVTNRDCEEPTSDARRDLPPDVGCHSPPNGEANAPVAMLSSQPAEADEQPTAQLPPRIRRESPLELSISRGRGGELVQHAGTWVVLGMLAAFGMYDWIERLRAEAQADAERDGKPFVAGPVLRLAIDAVVIALMIGEQCVEGVRRIATPSAATLLRSNAALSPEWVRTVIGRFAHYRGQLLHLTTTFALVAAAQRAEAERAVFYVDNHLRPYTGKHTIRKGWRMQDKRVRPGMTDFCVHDEDGRPLLRFYSPAHESLLQHLRPVAAVLRAALDQAGANNTKVMLVFDRAGAFASEMAALREADREFVTYERAPYKLLPQDDFDRTLELRGETIRFTEAQQKNLRGGRGRVRRVALLMPDGKQVNIVAVSTAPAEELIMFLLARWARQENQFKHGVERWGINQLDGRRIEPYPEDAIIPNPARRRLDHALHIARAAEGETLRQLARLDIDDPRRAKLDAEIQRLRQQQDEIEAQRQITPKRAPLRETPLSGKLVLHRDRYKLVIDTLRVLLANVESELAARLGPHLYRPAEAKKTLANLLASPGFVRLTSRSVRVTLAPAATKRECEAFTALLRYINAARLRLPGDVSRRVLRFRLLQQ